mgnify:CR=1 FL=1
MHDVTHYKHPDGSPFPASDCPDLTALPASRRSLVDRDRFGGLTATVELILDAAQDAAQRASLPLAVIIGEHEIETATATVRPLRDAFGAEQADIGIGDQQDAGAAPRRRADGAAVARAADIVQEVLAARPLAEWITRFAGMEGQWAIAQDPWEVGQDPALRANGLIAEVLDMPADEALEFFSNQPSIAGS